MAIADKLTRLAQTKAAIKVALIAKGSDPGNAPFKDYPGLIENIQSGGGGDTSIEDGLVDGTLTEYSNDRVATIRDYAFRSCSSLITASLPAATNVGTYAFCYCLSLTTANLPVATYVGVRAFENCSSLITASLPVATIVEQYTFYNCWSLTTVNIPAATDVGQYAFYGCSSLTTLDLPVATSIGASAFRNGHSLTTVILRNTTKVCTLASASAFTNCYHYHGTTQSTYNPEGLQDGYIYVPADLIDDYTDNTNWSTLATQFRALEDFTVDGTTTGELDESKI